MNIQYFIFNLFCIFTTVSPLKYHSFPKIPYNNKGQQYFVDDMIMMPDEALGELFFSTRANNQYKINENNNNNVLIKHIDPEPIRIMSNIIEGYDNITIIGVIIVNTILLFIQKMNVMRRR